MLVRYVKRDGEVLPVDQVRRVAAFLAPSGEDAEIPIERGRPQAVNAGQYTLVVNTTDWSTSDPIHLTLRPGEERTVEVELDKLRFYQQAWFPWAIVGLAAGALLVSAQIILSSDEGREPAESRPAPVYTFDIP